MQTIQDFEHTVVMRERKEEQLAFNAISRILKTDEGVDLFKYLFKNFEVGTLPDRAMSGDELHEYLGFLRAGNSIFKIASAADSEASAAILANIEKEKDQDERTKFRIEHNIRE